MATLVDLLERGFFPKELPPPFSTSSFAQIVHTNLASLPNSFLSGTKAGRISTHNLARVSTLRRALGIPNPIHYFRLCKEISDNWTALEAHCRQSPVSLSKPIVDPNRRRALTPEKSFESLRRHRASLRARSRYILRTDLSRFYHSVYTHAIPWALHGKALAKNRRRDLTLLGNRLDKLISEGQD